MGRYNTRRLLDRLQSVFVTKKLLLVVIACQVLCFAYFFSYKVVDIHNSIDGSWQFTLSEARNAPGELGADLLYTYGPMFERLAVYPVPADGFFAFLTIALLFVAMLIASVLAVISFWRTYVAHNRLLAWIIATLAGYVLLTITQIDSLFYLSLLVTILAARREQNPWLRTAILCGLALFSLYKVSFSITFLVALPAAFIVSAELNQIRRALMQWLIAVAGYVVLFVVTTGGSLFDFVRYLSVGLQNSIAYNEFMSLGFADNKAIVIAFALIYFTSAALCLGLYVYLFKRRSWRNDIVFASIFIFFVSFFVFKQSVVRSDDHLLAFTPFLPLILLAPALLITTVKKVLPGKTKLLAVSFAALCLGCLAGHLLLQNTLQSKTPADFVAQRAGFVADGVGNSSLNYAAFSGARNQIAADLSSREAEISAVKAELDAKYPGQTIVVYGNTTILSDFLREGRNVLQAPFIQNYAAFPPQLFDPLYIDFLAEHPDALVFLEETEASINERIPAHELNDFFMYLANNYKQIFKNPAGTQFILQRIDSKKEQCQALSYAEQTKGTSLAIPPLKLTHNQYIKMKVDLPPSLAEAAVGAFLKSPVYNLTLINQDGGTMIRRTTPSILAHGVAVNPAYLSYRALSDATDFGLTHVIISGGIDRQASYIARFELCTF